MRENSSWWQNPRAIAVVVDTPGWFDLHADVLVDAIRALHSHEEVGTVDIAFCLSCMKIDSAETLAKARVNRVAHSSDLPNGRGFSPVVRQILEGACDIPIRFLHAEEPVDSGDIVLSKSIAFEGHEQNDEGRHD